MNSMFFVADLAAVRVMTFSSVKFRAESIAANHFALQKCYTDLIFLVFIFSAASSFVCSCVFQLCCLSCKLCKSLNF